jgi:hypothetical protein
VAVLHEVGETAGALHDVDDHCPVVLHIVVALHDVENCPVMHFVGVPDPAAVEGSASPPLGAQLGFSPMSVVVVHNGEETVVPVALHDVEDCPVLGSVGLLRPVVFP